MVRLTKDFTAFYAGYLLPTLRIQYKDFARWQNSEKKRALIKQQEVFWLQEFPGEIPVLNLPTDFPRPSVKSFAGSFEDFFIDSKESGALKKLAIKEDVTLYMILLTIFYILLSKLTQQEEIIIGTAAAGRRHADLQELIGFFVNTLALKSHPESQKTASEFLKEVRALSLALYLQPLGDRFLGRSHVNYNGFNHAVVNIYDAKLNKLKEVYRVKDPYQGPGKGYKVLDTVFVFRAYKDKILVPGKDDATIDVFDVELSKLFSIHLDQKRRKIDQKTRERLTHLMKTSPDTKDAYELIRPLSFPGYFPIIANFFVSDDTIYVMTWKKENGSNEFFTYDMNGKFKKRLLIPIKYETELSAYPTTIKKGKLYQLVENENKEEWEFHVSQIK